MPSEPSAPREKQPATLTRSSTLVRMVGIAVVILGVVATFLYLGGWFSPHKLTPARFVDEFQRVNGRYSGFRRNHAKGVCVRGFFDSNGQGTRLSKAVVFRSGRVSVIGRFSIGGGDPYASDALSDVRGLGLQYSLPDGEEWRTAMINLPVFPFKDAASLLRQSGCIGTRPQDASTRSGERGGVPREPSGNCAGARNHQEPCAVVRFRQHHVLRSQCIPFHQCGRHVDPRALDAGARCSRLNLRVRPEQARTRTSSLTG